MTFKRGYRKSGFTLLELIIVLGIMAIVMSASYAVFHYGNKISEMGNEQFAVQSDVRLVMDQITSELRYAKELAIVTISDAKKLSDPYSYIYIENGVIHRSIFDEVTSVRATTVLSATVSDTKTHFAKNPLSTDVLNIQIGAQDGDQTYTITSELKLLNLNLVKPIETIKGSNLDFAVQYRVAPLAKSFVYTITFNSAGGSSVPSITGTGDTPISEPTNPTRTGYLFSGWTPSFPARIPVGGAVLTATWTLAPNWYTLTFDSAGGSSVVSITQENGTPVSEPSTPPTRPGYNFMGWSPAFPSTMPEGGGTFMAQWEAQSADATLKSADLSVGTLSSTFLPGTQVYSITADKNATITISVEKNDLMATIDKTSAIVNKQNNIADFTIKAENGDQKIYHFVFGALNDDASLSGINLSKGTLTPEFDPAIHTYSIKGKATDTVTMTPVLSDGYASVSPLTADISVVNPTRTLTVTAQDGVTQEVYSFSYVVLNSDATLSAIGLSKGTLIPVFNSSQKTYSVKGSGTDNITVTPITNNVLATVSPTAIVLNKTNATAMFTVTAEDGTTTGYSVSFVLMSSDNTLSSIALSQGELNQAFDPLILNYTFKGSATENMTVTPVKNAASADVSPVSKVISNANKVASFVVTAEDGTPKTYTVTFVLKSSDATLSNIGLSSRTLTPTFSSGTLNYTVRGKSTDNIIVTPVKTNANATVTPTEISISNTSKVATFTVTAEDGTLKTYTVTFVLMSSDATLKTVTLSGGATMNPAPFSPMTYDYSVSQNCNVTVTTNDINAVVTPSISVNVNPGQPVTFKVTAEDGTVLNYTFHR